MAMKATVTLDVEETYQAFEDAVVNQFIAADRLIENKYSKGRPVGKALEAEMMINYNNAIEAANNARRAIHQLMCHCEDSTIIDVTPSIEAVEQPPYKRPVNRIRLGIIRAIRTRFNCSYYMGCEVFNAICDRVPEINQYRGAK